MIKHFKQVNTKFKHQKDSKWYRKTVQITEILLYMHIDIDVRVHVCINCNLGISRNVY